MHILLNVCFILKSHCLAFWKKKKGKGCSCIHCFIFSAWCWNILSLYFWG